MEAAIVLVWILGAGLVLVVADQKGRNPIGWVLASLVLSPLLILLALAAVPSVKRDPAGKRPAS